MNSYTEAIEYLYARLPMFTRDGASAINKGLDRTIRFCEHLGNPQHTFKSIHVAGTNGKGSSSHMLTSILETAGYKTGLYTSPHLIDFRERIRVHGQPASEAFVVDFVRRNQAIIEELMPSFFEVTVAMAFDYFRQQQVDIAIIEVGLGGRLDSTNIITPILSLITNIGMDHMDMLGDTLPKIASEKAGIIKTNTPVVISENQVDTRSVFEARAQALYAPITFASDVWSVEAADQTQSSYQEVTVKHVPSGQAFPLQLDLKGSYQTNNIKGVLSVLEELRQQSWKISQEDLVNGLRQVQEKTGLMGRWQTISTVPHVICDTGHNVDGIKQVVENIHATPHLKLHIVIGAMKDKDLTHTLPLLPADAVYYFCAPALPRAMPAEQLQQLAKGCGLLGKAYGDVSSAYQAALQAWQAEDLVFVGGSTFVVAEVLTLVHNN